MLQYYCIFIFMTTLISSKPISNICRACKLSNLAQQLGEGGGVCTIVISNQAPNTRPDGVHQNICIPYPFFPNNILL